MLGGLLIALLAVGTWRLVRAPQVAAPDTSQASPEEPAPPRREMPVPAPVPPPPPSPVAVAPAPPAPPAPAPAPPDEPDALEHPHPITPQHVRIQRENQMIGAMNDAMDLGDGARLRKILNEYREEFPEDPSQLQEGYRIIAECLERPGPAATAAGQRYYDVERGSTLRLFVGRHCLHL